MRISAAYSANFSVVFVAEKYATRTSVFSSGTVGTTTLDELGGLPVESGFDDEADWGGALADDELADGELTDDELTDDELSDGEFADDELSDDKIMAFSDEEVSVEAFDDCTGCVELSPVPDKLSPLDGTDVPEVTDETEEDFSEPL
ncbi:MAG: hypothetical protein NC394_09400 [Bacteroides sp.]|nr:hypothetical protein [Bacteroides sp.]